MTIEAAIAKLAYLFGLKLEVNEIKRLFVVNLRGELTPPPLQEQFSVHQKDFIQSVSEMLKQNKESSENAKMVQSLVMPNLCYEAAKFGKIGIMQELQKYGHDFNEKDCDDRTALHIACSAGQLSIV